MIKVYKIVLTIMVVSFSVYASAMIPFEEALDFFIKSGYNIEMFEQKEAEINNELTEREAQERYNRLTSMDKEELKAALANSCLSNPVLENLHYFLDEKGEILPDSDILLLNEYKATNDRLGDLVDKDYKKEAGKYKRIYAFLDLDVKKDAVKDKIITDLWLGPRCFLSSSSVVDNKKLKYVKIDPNVEEINEDAFQNNPNIEAYHVCCETYDMKDKNNIISYRITEVPGEVPYIAYVMDDMNNTVSYFLKTIYQNDEVLFLDAYRQEYYVLVNGKLEKKENNNRNNQNIYNDGPRKGINNEEFIQEEYVEPDIVLIGGAYRDSYVYTISNDDDIYNICKRYIDVNGVLFEKPDLKNGAKLLFYPIGRKDESYVIPDGVEQIGNVAFASAKNLKTVTIPKSVVKIGNNAFHGAKVTLKVSKDSYAEKYAKNKKIKYEIIKEDKQK